MRHSGYASSGGLCHNSEVMRPAHQHTRRASDLNESVRTGRLGEFERILRIGKLFATSGAKLVKVGIGDDAAVLRPSRSDLVWTVDSSVQDVHFRLGWLSEVDIGWRSFHAAASDLAAMGARPVGALSALELPKRFAEDALLRLLQGQRDASKTLGCPIIGGNLAAAKALAITTTLLGRTKQALLRSHARVGDEVWLIGDVGLAAAGLACLAGKARRRRGSAVECCVAAWRRPAALIDRGRALVGRAHAVIDVSDGLVGDAQHIAESSQVRIELDAEALNELLKPELRDVAKMLSRPAIDFALFGGEDYALLATGLSSRRPRWARRIGKVVPGKGIWWSKKGISCRQLKRGYDHFED